MMIEMRKTFGAKIRKLRKERGLSLRQFALMIGIDKGYLVDVEYGRKSPTLDTLAKIACGLDVEMSELLELSLIHIFAAGYLAAAAARAVLVVDQQSIRHRSPS